jgi:WD40 repeat protein
MDARSAATGILQVAWMHSLPNSARGLALARERGWVLIWDDKHWLYLLNHAGAVQAQWHLDNGLTAAAVADDGSAYAAVGGKGEVYWLAPDLMPRWQKVLPNPALAVALDPFGQYLAASDAKGLLRVYDRAGQAVCKVESPRPLHHLAFVPGASALVAAADYGLVACLNLNGKWLWRDGLVAHVGSLSVTGDGQRIAFACFSEGIQRYNLAGKRLAGQTLAGPVRLAALSYEGDRILAAFASKQIHLLDGDAQELANLTVERSVTAVGLGALADTAVVGLSSGSVLGLDVRG